MEQYDNSNEKLIPSENSQWRAPSFIIGHKPFQVVGGKLADGNRRSRSISKSFRSGGAPLDEPHRIIARE